MTIHEVNDANIVSFINDDPLNVGFGPVKAQGNGAIMPLANGLDSPGAGQVAGNPISSTALFNLINADDFNAMTTQQLAQLDVIMGVQSIDVGNTATQQKLDNLFETYPTSQVAVSGTYTRLGSPWEVWFGPGQQATGSLLDSARNSGSGNNF